MRVAVRAVGQGHSGGSDARVNKISVALTLAAESPLRRARTPAPCAARRRFRGLVRAHGWRAATERHFPEVAAAVLAAATGGAAAALLGPSAAEWQATYKLLTLVPWTTTRAADVSYDTLAPMCVRLRRRMLAAHQRDDSAR